MKLLSQTLESVCEECWSNIAEECRIKFIEAIDKEVKTVFKPKPEDSSVTTLQKEDNIKKWSKRI